MHSDKIIGFSLVPPPLQKTLGHLIKKSTRAPNSVFWPEMVYVTVLLITEGGSCHPTYHGLRLWGVLQLEDLVSNQVSPSLLNKTRKKHSNFYHIYFKKNIAVSCLICYENIIILLWLQNFKRAVENEKNHAKFGLDLLFLKWTEQNYGDLSGKYRTWL